MIKFAYCISKLYLYILSFNYFELSASYQHIRPDELKADVYSDFVKNMTLDITPKMLA